MISKNTITVIFIFAIAAVLTGAGWYYFATQKETTEVLVVSENITPPLAQATTSETKTYRNEKWGLEFQYPNDWILKENAFGSYYSKFNIWIKVPFYGEKLDLAFGVNIVLPEFPNRSFHGIEKTVSEITVAGVQGIKYEFEGFPHTAVILPFGKYKVILATGDGSKQYLDEFSQILSSFKFLK